VALSRVLVHLAHCEDAHLFDTWSRGSLDGSPPRQAMRNPCASGAVDDAREGSRAAAAGVKVEASVKVSGRLAGVVRGASHGGVARHAADSGTCASEQPAIIRDLCAHNTTRDFWSALSRALSSTAGVTAGAPPPRSPQGLRGASRPEGDGTLIELSAKERARRNYLEADRLVAGCAGVAEGRYREACQAYWTAQPHCDTRGKLRLWCR